MSEKVFHCNVKREDGYLYFINKDSNVARVRRGESKQEVVCKTDFTKEDGWVYYVDKSGDVSRSRMKSFREYAEIRTENTFEELVLTEKNWIAGAIKHPGRCTKGSPNYDCPKGSRQWDLAQRFRSGDLHHGDK